MHMGSSKLGRSLTNTRRITHAPTPKVKAYGAQNKKKVGRSDLTWNPGLSTRVRGLSEPPKK